MSAVYGESRKMAWGDLARTVEPSTCLGTRPIAPPLACASPTKLTFTISYLIYISLLSRKPITRSWMQNIRGNSAQITHYRHIPMVPSFSEKILDGIVIDSDSFYSHGMWRAHYNKRGDVILRSRNGHSEASLKVCGSYSRNQLLPETCLQGLYAGLFHRSCFSLAMPLLDRSLSLAPTRV